MSTLVTRAAPDFTAPAVLPDGSTADITLSKYRGRYVMLYFFPWAFTFVCPTEILAFDRRIAEFKERNCDLIGVSVDSHYPLSAWRNTPVEKGGIGAIRHPVAADLSKSIAK